ncbi:MAG TPA: radical SAM protein [Candidatus Bathyarchaeota archaeon]|nr:radical SAM protein [Candidatus Bathyarchaeota archaeon]
MKLSLFKAARGAFCTCPPKYNLNVYKGRCAHGCLYCYSIKFPPFREGPPEPRKALRERIHLMARATRPIMPVMVSDCTDPYQPIEAGFGLTRHCLQVLIKHSFPILVVTKSNLVVRDADVLARGQVVVSITITTLDRELARRLEPGAPSPSERLKALERLSELGIPTTARVDPILPGLNDDLASLEELIGAIAEAGAKQVTSSTFKPVRGTFRLMRELDEGLYEVVRPAYLAEGAKWISGYLYLPAKRRYELMQTVRGLAISEGLEFAVCREGFTELNTTICDGTAFIRQGAKGMGLGAYI